MSGIRGIGVVWAFLIYVVSCLYADDVRDLNELLKKENYKERYAPLIKASPFLTKDWIAKNANNDQMRANRIRFLSYAYLNDKWKFGLYNEMDRVSIWLGVGETDEGIEVISFDENSEKLMINSPSGPLELSLDSQNSIISDGGDVEGSPDEAKERRREKKAAEKKGKMQKKAKGGNNQ
jgi:hypothetical protein